MTTDKLRESLALYAVTDRTWTINSTLAEQVESVILGGVTMIQVREKSLLDTDFEIIARSIQQVTQKYMIPIIVNDNIEVAKSIDAAGVHIGQNDQEIIEVRKRLGPDKIIGVSVQTLEQALKAEREGADYLGVGAVFQTQTKSDATLVTLDVLKSICHSVSIPVVAIGGINEKNIHELYGTGLAGVSVISALFGSDDPQKASEYLRSKTSQLKFQSPKKILTIAGSDCSGGAGVQADLKTIEAHGMYGMTVITALTAQNTLGVEGVFESTPEFVKAQLDAIYSDMPPDAIKIGMVSNPEIIKVISEFLQNYPTPYVILDPVMVSTSGSKLISEDALDVLIHHLMPYADCITPNLEEAEVLCGFHIQDETDMMKAAKVISQKIKTTLLIKGGHLKTTSNDLLFTETHYKWFTGNRIKTENTHGTGCTLSSAIACHLAATGDLEISIARAKSYVTDTLSIGLDIGKGNGPLWHSANTQHKYL